MRTYILFFILTAFGFFCSNAQVGESFGGPGTDYGYETEATTDGGFVVAGYTTSYGAGSSDYWLVKFDSLGNKVWSRAFGTSSYEQIYCLRLAADGGYLLAGYSGIYGGGKEGALMYKIDTGGNVVWTKAIHMLTVDHSHSLFENLEGGYYMAGHTESMGNASGSMWVVKMDSARNILWDSAYTPINVSEHAHAAALTPDSGVVVLGHTDQNSYINFRLLKLDKLGHTQWSKIYASGSTSNDTPYEIRVTRQGNYAMFGYSEAVNTTFWLKVVDTAGNSLIDKHYGTGANYCWSGRQTADDGFLIIGYKDPGMYGYQDMIIFKTDTVGNLQWTKQYGGTANDIGYGFTPFHGNKYVLAGGSSSFTSGGGEDMWIVLIDSAGNFANYPMIAVDAGVKKVLQPTGIDCSSNFTPMIVLRNAGVDTLDSVYIYYQLDTMAPQSIRWTGSLASAVSDTITISLQNASEGQHFFTVWTSMPNGVADLNPANDTSFSTFDIDTIRSLIPFSEGFESDTLPPLNWALAGATNIFSIDTVGGFGNSPHSLRADFFHISSGTARLISPYVDLSNLTAPITLSFSLAYPLTGSPTYNYRDTLKVEVSHDCSNTWNPVYTKADTLLATASPASGQFVPDSSAWRKEYINLDSFAGKTIQVRFEAKSGYGQDLYIDDINFNQDTIPATKHDTIPDTTAAVVHPATEFGINAWPNPATDQLIVNVPDAPGKITLSLFNILGETMYLHEADKHRVIINVSTLPPGIYLLKASDGKNVVSKKISIVH